MFDSLEWLLDLKNSKITALLIFFTTFVAIILYVYGSKRRGKRLESYRDIPFLDDESDKLSPHYNQESERNASEKNGK